MVGVVCSVVWGYIGLSMVIASYVWVINVYDRIANALKCVCRHDCKLALANEQIISTK